MNYPEELVERYAEFYRPQFRKGKGPSSTACVKPLKIAAKILLHPDNLRMSQDELKQAIAAEVSKLMAQIHSSTAEGFWVLHGEEERGKIWEFARFFVDDFFYGCYSGRRDLLVGRKFAFIEHTCEWIIRDPKYRLKTLSNTVSEG